MAYYYCKYCGQRFSSVALLQANRCIRHPDGPQNHHELYEGGESSHYVCKYCGQKYFSIAEMTANRDCARFISRYGCEQYFRFNKELLISERQNEMLQEISNLNLD